MKIFFDTEFTGLHKDTTLISIGLIGEYLSKMYIQVKNRPVYLIKEYKDTQITDN